MSGDFDFEPVRGLPEVLPEGERMLWQGSPDWQELAIHAFHVRKIAFYFLALAVLQGAVRLGSGSTLVEATRPFLWLIPLGLVAVAILMALAFISARTTVYTITNKRVVMRIGIAIPITINLPFKLVDGAAVRLFNTGAGEVTLKLHGDDRLAYFVLWPHVRPFYLRTPQPALRAIPDANRVASLLANALAGTSSATPLEAPATVRHARLVEAVAT